MAHWGGSATPKGPNGGGRNHPQRVCATPIWPRVWPSHLHGPWGWFSHPKDNFFFLHVFVFLLFLFVFFLKKKKKMRAFWEITLQVEGNLGKEKQQKSHMQHTCGIFR
jgi:hypothetical protein